MTDTAAAPQAGPTRVRVLSPWQAISPESKARRRKWFLAVGVLFVLVSIPFGIYRLKAGSTTWEKISDTVGIREVAVGPDGMVYAKTTGLIESADSGRTWRSWPGRAPSRRRGAPGGGG